MQTALSRRRLMASMGLGAGALLLPRLSRSATLSTAVETAAGRVVDTEAKSVSASGIAGVMVSNGRDVVTTNDDGRWALPVRSGDTVFVIKPAHWSVAPGAGRNGFCYLHRPSGTPAGFGGSGPGIAATGPLPASIEFPLIRNREADCFEAMLIADTQPANARELGYLDRLLTKSLACFSPAFAIHHGDVMADDLSLFPDYLRLIERSEFPWYHCPGNHDMNLDAPFVAYAFEAWKRYIGPTHCAFQHAGATFILLNNVMPLDPADASAGRFRYRGHLGDDQLAFVANVLRHTPLNSLVVVSTHIPLVSFDTPDSPSDTTGDRAKLLALLSGRPHNVSFSGHSHTTEHHYLGRENGYAGERPHHHHVLTAASGSWWSGPPGPNGVPVSVSRDGTPKGFHVLTVDGNQYTTRFEAFDDIGGTAARAFRTDGGATLLVDVFDGGPATEVWCEVAGQLQTPVALSRVSLCDPFVENICSAHPELCKPWVKATPSSHTWIAQVPIEATLVIGIKDEYGRRSVVSAPTAPAEHA